MPKRGNYINRPPKVPKNTEFEKKSGKSFRMCEGIVLKCLVKYLPLHIGYNHYRVGTKTIAVEPRDVIQLSMGPQKLNN
jgi:hypothetical protein